MAWMSYTARHTLHRIEACRKMGGDLVEVNDVIEHNFLMSKAPPLNDSRVETGYWIGLTDKDRNNTFVWISSGEVPTFTLWRDDQPTHAWGIYDEDLTSNFKGMAEEESRIYPNQ
ncbi:macrophage mannose receptor 1-like [Mercenaria mercenaria]|uniref:macrophage mannose receptor 1-like n=1 Tax=Mercenaria mercenaria TaxID=6596 RepID=UPI00234E4189|nr:macrophage mannose receptor 1-like [Mercenaria mercenaria]